MSKKKEFIEDLEKRTWRNHYNALLNGSKWSQSRLQDRLRQALNTTLTVLIAMVKILSFVG